MQLSLTDKVVLVTGGSKGIGRAIVESFLREGAKVSFCARTSSELLQAVKELEALVEGNAGHVSAYDLDISNKEQLEKWVKLIGDREGGIDIVVSNVSSLKIPDTPASWEAGYQVDMMGTVNLVAAALPYLEKNKGNIVTISSVTGRDIDFTAPSPYGAYKAALIHYTAQLAHSLAPKGVRANTVSPGNVYIEDGVWGSIEKGNPELFQSQMKLNPMGRMGKPEEVANAVVFLASERASFISGTNLVVDGSLCTGVQF